MTRVWLAIATLCVFASLVAAVVHVSPAVLGATASLGFFALAAACMAAAESLGARDDVREPRVAPGPSHPPPLPADARAPAGFFDRWWFLAAGSVAALGLTPFLALARRSPGAGTAWRAGSRLVKLDGTALDAASLAVGAVETVYPQGHVGAPLAEALLIRLGDGEADGYVAYSKVCTHAGCPVAIYRRAARQLYCPCHQSVFDVTDHARPIDGPATRALPQLGLDVDAHGYLIARGDFDAPVGPDSWDRTL